jgi:hypothetical protein
MMMANAVCRQPTLTTKSTPVTSEHILGLSLHRTRASITQFSLNARSPVFLSVYVHANVIVNVQHNCYGQQKSIMSVGATVRDRRIGPTSYSL